MKNIDVDLVLKGVPRSKKNGMVIARNSRNRLFMTQGKVYQQYEKDCLLQIPAKDRIGIDYPVNVRCMYYMSTHRRVDLGNLLAATCDILTKAKVLEDDNAKIVVGHDGSRVLVDKDDPRVEIFIERVEVRPDAI